MSQPFIEGDWDHQHRNNASDLFPPNPGIADTALLLKGALDALRKSNVDSKAARFGHGAGPQTTKPEDLEARFGHVRDTRTPSDEVLQQLVDAFLPSAPNWRSPELQYNVCSPVNVAAAAAMSIAQDANVHNIHTGFAGYCLSAERAVTHFLASIIGRSTQQVRGLFTFGGTGSNMYAMKIAINKSIPSAGKCGVPSNVHFLVTKEAHFSHQTSLDWIGVGVDRAISIDADAENRSSVEDAGDKARKIIRNGGILAGITLNGGTVYDHVIDNITDFVTLRDQLVREFSLSYRPHIHVDSVIGWIWLMYAGYDFSLNPLSIPSDVIEAINKQYSLIKQVARADSWGVDFHKALGGCPVPSAMFLANDYRDILLLSKSNRGTGDTHQLGGDWSHDDPSDVTLETSRSAGPALAALAALHTLGISGHRLYLANQVNATLRFRTAIACTDCLVVANPHSMGFNTLVLVLPPGLPFQPKNWQEFLDYVAPHDDLVQRCNTTVREFFNWATQPLGGGTPLGCSFSRSFRRTERGVPISALKYYFVSPHTDAAESLRELEKLIRQFGAFMQTHPPK